MRLIDLLCEFAGMLLAVAPLVMGSLALLALLCLAFGALAGSVQ